MEKEPKDARGWAQSAGSAKPPCLHVALPLEPPLRGTRTCEVVQNSRRAKSEWRSKFPPGHWALAMWKIGAGAVPLPRLALPSRCSRCWAVGRGLLDAPRMRAGQCPAPTIKRDGFRIHVGAAHRAARLHGSAGGPRASPTQPWKNFLKTVGEGTTPLIKGRCRAQRDRGDRDLPLPPHLGNLSVNRRAGLGPAPTNRRDTFRFAVGAAISRP